MAGFIHFLKALLIPLFLALTLYLLLIHAVLPFLRRNRQLYTPYLPLSTSALASTAQPGSTSLLASTPSRSTFRSALVNLFVPSTLRHRTLGAAPHDAEDPDDLFDDEEGEGMVGFDPIDERRREALEQRRSLLLEAGLGIRTLGVRGADEAGGAARLSRELEEGFCDESSDDDDDDEGSAAESEGARGRSWGDERLRGRWF